MSTYKLLDDEEQDVLTLCSDDQNEEDDDFLTEEMKAKCLRTTGTCSMIIGVIEGIFVQGSTLGLNFLISTLGGGSPTANTYVSLTVAWSLIASSLGVTILLFLRNLVVTSFFISMDTTESGVKRQQKEEFMSAVIERVEKFFAVGTLAGVGLAWCITDILLEIKTHLLHSSLSFLVAMIWYSYAQE